MKIELGRFNTLQVVKFVDFGLYLDGGEIGEILLPTRYVPEDCEEGDELKVFLYLDNEERLIATTLTPYVQVGEFASLEVSWINEYGAFLNWGLMKDLFVPFSEQKKKMQVGERHVVYVYIDDETERIVASAKVDKFLLKERPDLKIGDEVSAMVWQSTNLGFKAIVENKYSGLFYKNEVFQQLRKGQHLTAYVKQVRDDFKLDLELQKAGYVKVDNFASELLNFIKENGGSTHFNDKSDAEDIYDTFGVSKKTFKKAVGELYKKRLILVSKEGIKLS